MSGKPSGGKKETAHHSKHQFQVVCVERLFHSCYRRVCAREHVVAKPRPASEQVYNSCKLYATWPADVWSTKCHQTQHDSYETWRMTPLILNAPCDHSTACSADASSPASTGGAAATVPFIDWVRDRVAALTAAAAAAAFAICCQNTY